LLLFFEYLILNHSPRFRWASSELERLIAEIIPDIEIKRETHAAQWPREIT